MAKDIEKLKVLCDYAVSNPDWQPRLINGVLTTYCNFAAQYIASGMGCDDFEGMMANQIVERMKAKDGWAQVDGPTFARWAQEGGLGFAGEEENVHGHITAGYPAPMEMSNSLGKLVPMVAHVGKAPCAVKKASQAFPVAKGEPGYWIWTLAN